MAFAPELDPASGAQRLDRAVSGFPADERRRVQTCEAPRLRFPVEREVEQTKNIVKWKSAARSRVKAVLGVPTTSALIVRLDVDKSLGRIPGWERRAQVPSEATFSQAFADGSPVAKMVDRVDLRAPAGEAFARTLKTAIVEFGALASAGLGPSGIAGYEDFLTNLAAAILFPTITQGLDRSTAQCAPVTIRRARDVIKDNAAEPIRMSTLAADLGLPMRTLASRLERPVLAQSTL